MIVLDACGAVEIACETEKGLAAKSLINDGEFIISCDLLNAEVVSAFYKYAKAGIIDIDKAYSRIDSALKLVDKFYDISILNHEVVSEAIRLGHPVYDIYYLVLARRLGATLLTFDRKLRILCEQCGVSVISDIKLS